MGVVTTEGVHRVTIETKIVRHKIEMTQEAFVAEAQNLLIGLVRAELLEARRTAEYNRLGNLQKIKSVSISTDEVDGTVYIFVEREIGTDEEPVAEPA